jgi:hypothetical protein
MRAYECLFAPYTKKGSYIKQTNLEDSNMIFRNVLKLWLLRYRAKGRNEHNVVGVNLELYTRIKGQLIGFI